jgi:hypothetical protein
LAKKFAIDLEAKYERLASFGNKANNNQSNGFPYFGSVKQACSRNSRPNSLDH